VSPNININLVTKLYIKAHTYLLHFISFDGTDFPIRSITRPVVKSELNGHLSVERTPGHSLLRQVAVEGQGLLVWKAIKKYNILRLLICVYALCLGFLLPCCCNKLDLGQKDRA